MLYNASLPEIRSIVPMPDGTIYAAALGGSIANRTAPLTSRALASPTSSPSPRHRPRSRFRIPILRPARNSSRKPSATTPVDSSRASSDYRRQPTGGNSGRG